MEAVDPQTVILLPQHSPPLRTPARAGSASPRRHQFSLVSAGRITSQRMLPKSSGSPNRIEEAGTLYRSTGCCRSPDRHSPHSVSAPPGSSARRTPLAPLRSSANLVPNLFQIRVQLPRHRLRTAVRPSHWSNGERISGRTRRTNRPGFFCSSGSTHSWMSRMALRTSDTPASQ